MARFFKRLLIVVLGVVVMLALGITAFLFRGGAFKSLTASVDRSCRPIPTAAGSAEDIQIDHRTGIAYLSAYDRRAVVAGEDVTGTILQLDLNSAAPVPEPALATVPDNFKPHGLSLFHADDGSTHLYVISHISEERHRVEQFTRGPDEAVFQHSRSIEDRLFSSPNDLVAVGEGLFFVANDTGARNRFEQATEMLFARRLSPLVMYDSGSASVVRSDLASPAGINADAQYLYVAETGGKRLSVFRLDDLSGPPHQTIDLPSAPDNIDIAEDGSLWVAAHANTLALIRHFGDPQSPAPSQVFKIDTETFEPAQQFLDLGDGLSAGSVGATYGNWLLLGSITEPHVLLCAVATR
jgi:arylesterase/paraoxonase